MEEKRRTGEEKKGGREKHKLLGKQTSGVTTGIRRSPERREGGQITRGVLETKGYSNKRTVGGKEKVFTNRDSSTQQKPVRGGWGTNTTWAATAKWEVR